MGIASASLPASSPGTSIEYFMYDARLDDALKELDPAHRLAELTTSWKELSTSFGEKLQVSVFVILYLDFGVFFSFFFFILLFP